MTAEIRLLGPLEVVDDAGAPVDIGGAQPRVVLAMLVTSLGKVVAVDALVDAVWEDSPPDSASGTLQTYVSRLRRSLDAVGGSIVREPAGYRLDISPDAVDAHHFERLAEEGRAALDHGDHDAARSLLADAERLWRGPALLDVRDRPRIAGIARRLDDRRLAAIEDRVAADLALGRHAALVAELAQLVAEHPLREGLWELLALARYRAGMQADALRAISDARSTLVDALGVEPGSGLRNLEQAILAHDPTLDLRSHETASTSPVLFGGSTGFPVDPPNRTGGVQPGDTSGPRIVGRDRELAVMAAALDHLTAGRPGVVVVRGEAGVGKTRLVEQLAGDAERRGGRVVWGRCLESGAAPAYWPWLGALRPIRSSDPRRTNDAVDQLLDATGSAEATPAAGDPSRLISGVLALLDEAAAEQPLVVVLEDLQWADAESLELASQVTSGLTDGAVLLVFTLREGSESHGDAVLSLLSTVSRRPGTKRLHLTGLDTAATCELLAQVAGRPISDDLALAVHERVDGNPFFAIELQRLLDSEGLTDAASVAATAVPVGVRDVVRQRLSQLPPSTLELLRYAAVAGRELDVELVSVASRRSLDDCLDDLEVAVTHRLLVDGGAGGGMKFSHALVREVVVDDLSALRQARHHLAIADALVALGRSERDAEIIAEHLWAAVPIGTGRRAAEALDAAATVALRRSALGTACDLLSRVLELRRDAGTDPADAAAELDALEKLTWALRAHGGYRAGLAHYPRGAELAQRLGRHETETQMQWAEWAAYDTACDFDRARPIAARFRSWAASSDDPFVRAVGFNAWAIQCWHDGDLAGSAQGFRLVAEAREAYGPITDERSLMAEVTLLSTGFGLYVAEQVGDLADPDEAFTAAAASMHGAVPVAMTWSFGCTSAASAGDAARLERYARNVMAAEAGETLGFWGSQARMYLGATLTATGRADEGRALLDEAHAIYTAAGLRTGLALMLAAAASAEVDAGDLDRAARLLASAQEEIDGGEQWPRPYVLLAAADVAEATGASVDAVTEMRRDAERTAASQDAAVAESLSRAAIAGQRWFGGSSTVREGSAEPDASTSPASSA